MISGVELGCEAAGNSGSSKASADDDDVLLGGHLRNNLGITVAFRRG